MVDIKRERVTYTCNIDAEKKQMIHKYLNENYSHGNDYLPEDKTITETIVFSDGAEIEIKCCGSDYGNAYAEAVLFKNGQEIDHSDVSDEFTGEWVLEDEQVQYVVNVA